MITAAIERLREDFSNSIRDCPTTEEFRKFRAFNDREGMVDWECFFVPEEDFYKDVLSLVSKDDVIFDVGAGDLRFDLLLSEKVKRVYAVEINPEIIGKAIQIIGMDMPRNVLAIRGNAWDFELPADVTTVICLMIHRKHDFPASWNRRIIFATYDGLRIRRES